MDGKAWLESLEPHRGSHDADWLDVLVYAEQEHGAGATRWLRDEMGVSLRQAQRYMKLDHAPQRGGPKAAAGRLMRQVGAEMTDASEAQRRADAADLIRAIGTLTPGKVWVMPKSGKGRKTARTIKALTGLDLGAVADAWADGDEDEAEELLSDAIIDAYGEQSATSELSSYLRIVDYETGIDYT